MNEKLTDEVKKYILSLIWQDKKFWETLDERYEKVTEIEKKTGVYDWFLKEIPFDKDDAFIDIGCATGGFLVEAVKRIWYGVGVDISEQSLGLAEKNLKKAGIRILKHPNLMKTEEIPKHTAFLIWASAHQLPFKNRFDKAFLNLAGSAAVFDKEYEATLLAEYVIETMRALKPGGMAYYYFDAYQRSEPRLFEKDYKKHILPSMNEELSEEGMQVEFKKTVFKRNLNLLSEVHKLGVALHLKDFYHVMFKLQKIQIRG